MNIQTPSPTPYLPANEYGNIFQENYNQQSDRWCREEIAKYGLDISWFEKDGFSFRRTRATVPEYNDQLIMTDPDGEKHWIENVESLIKAVGPHRKLRKPRVKWWVPIVRVLIALLDRISRNA